MASCTRTAAGTCPPFATHRLPKSACSNPYSLTRSLERTSRAWQPFGTHPSPQNLRMTRSSAAAGATMAKREAWYERPTPPNMRHVHSVQQFVNELEGAKEKLVVVDFFAPWCAACKALFPKVVLLAEANKDVIFLAINFDENKALARGVGVKVLPFFHLYRGAEGRVDAFSASVSKVQRLRDAIRVHNTPRCFLGSSPGLEEFPDVRPTPEESEDTEANTLRSVG
ncbi:hypothetical protein ACKKBG_A23645 [Auxenochlorella protothecoides x Auxenochlorella symbiontica]